MCGGEGGVAGGSHDGVVVVFMMVVGIFKRFNTLNYLIINQTILYIRPFSTKNDFCYEKWLIQETYLFILSLT